MLKIQLAQNGPFTTHIVYPLQTTSSNINNQMSELPWPHTGEPMKD